MDPVIVMPPSWWPPTPIRTGRPVPATSAIWLAISAFDTRLGDQLTRPVDAIKPTNNEGLYLLTAGVCNAEAIHALATDQPQAIFEKLRDQFDFIVIDAPPVLGISDSLSLGQYIAAKSAP